MQKEAIAAVEAFYDEFNRAAAASESSKALRPLFAPSCAPCEQGADLLDRLAQARQVVDGGLNRPVKLEAGEASGSVIAVRGEVRVDSAVVRDEGGNTVDAYPAEVIRNAIWILRREGARLVITSIRGDV